MCCLLPITSTQRSPFSGPRACPTAQCLSDPGEAGPSVHRVGGTPLLCMWPRLSDELPHVAPTKRAGDSVRLCGRLPHPEFCRTLCFLISHSRPHFAPSSATASHLSHTGGPLVLSSSPQTTIWQPICTSHKGPGIPWLAGAPARGLVSSVVGADQSPPFFSVPRPNPCRGEGEARTELKDRDVRF